MAAGSRCRGMGCWRNCPRRRSGSTSGRMRGSRGHQSAGTPRRGRPRFRQGCCTARPCAHTCQRKILAAPRALARELAVEWAAVSALPRRASAMAAGSRCRGMGCWRNCPRRRSGSTSGRMRGSRGHQSAGTPRRGRPRFRQGCCTARPHARTIRQSTAACASVLASLSRSCLPCFHCRLHSHCSQSSRSRWKWWCWSESRWSCLYCCPQSQCSRTW